jgi:hypothetical protein
MVSAPITLAESCGLFLAQARDLVRGMDAVAFSRPHAVGHGATIGQHLRHCLDHVEAFLEGMPSGLVDYDLRTRGGAAESDPAVGLERIDHAIRRLREAEIDEATPLRVKLDCGLGADSWRQSTAGRELQFLVSHLVHHFALVAILCRLQGIEPGEAFGVAPSTLRYRRGQ